MVVCLKGGAAVRSILEELWYGRIEPYDDIHMTKEERHLIDLIAENRERLEKTLTEQQKEQLEKYIDCSQELSDLMQKEVFLHGFRLGARIVIEALYREQDEDRR